MQTLMFNKGQTDVNLLYFSNAFDKVPHHRLMHKLEFYGIRGSLNSWTRSFVFLGNRLQQVLLDGVTSSVTLVQSGVPLLFFMFINDLPESIPPKSTAILFADDCILYRTIDTESEAHGLQLDLDRLRSGRRTGLWDSIPRNVKSFILHPKENQSIVYTQSGTRRS